MLEYMRKNVGSWVIKFMLFGIAIVFSFWGVGSYTGRDTNTIMTFDDIKVPYNEYRDIYNSLFESYREVYSDLDAATIEFLDIKTQAIDALVERYLLYEAARRMGVEVSGSEVAGQIASMPAFQENGTFSRRRYQAFLDYNRMTAEAYEASISRDLILAKVTELIKTSAVVTPQEIEDNVDLLTRKAVARILVLGPNDFVREVPPPSEGDLLDFFEDNIELYRVPEMFKQTVVVIDPASFKDAVEVTSEEMEQFYDDREREYTEPAGFRLKHILFSLPAEASAETVRGIRQQAEEVVRRIREGEVTFDEAVTEYSDDENTVGKGGDMGFLTVDELDRAVRNTATDLEPGEISDPVPTARGFEVIKVLEARARRLIPFSDVRDDILQRIQREKMNDLAYDQADDLLDEVLDTARPLRELAEEKNLMVTTTPLFSRTTPLEAMELPLELLQAAFDTEEEEVGDIYESNGKIYLFQTVERNDSYLPEMEQVRDQVEGGLLIEQSMEIAAEKALEMADAYNAGESLESLAASLGKRIIRTEPFNVMESSLNGIDDAGEVVETAFSLSEPGRAGAAFGLQAHYVVVLESFQEPGQEELAENRSMIVGALMFQREQDVFTGYVDALRAEMDDRIEINEEML